MAKNSKSSNLFNTLEMEAFRAGIQPRTAQSREWFRKRVQDMRGDRINRSNLMKEAPLVLRDEPAIGNMFYFFYDPKHKKTLPYYDSFPLVVVIGPAEGGFLGLNFHYLPPILRAKLLDALLDTLNNDKYDQSTRFTVTYSMLKSVAKMKYFKPCIKHYLTDHLASRLAKIPPTDYEIAVFLPVADWQKATSHEVYKDSRMRVK
jgi:hypothetical protein